MRVLTSATGTVTHLDGREYVAKYVDAPAKVIPAEGPVCNGVGASRGNVRWYERTAKAVTCKRCLKILAAAETEARAMHAQYMMTPEGQAQEDALAARRAEKCGQCGSERSNPRHHSAEGHAFVEHAEMDAELDAAAEVQAVPLSLDSFPVTTAVVRKSDGVTGVVESRYTDGRMAVVMADTGTVSVGHWSEFAPTALGSTSVTRNVLTSAFSSAGEDDLSGMYVELSSGLTEYVERGDRLQHKDSGTLATVTAVGPNALDLLTDDDTRRSGASWYWGRPAPAEAGPVDRQAVLSTRVDSLLDSGVHTQKCRDNAEAARCDGSCTRPRCRCTSPGQECTAENCPNTAYAALGQEGPLSRQLRELGSGSVQCPLLHAHAVHDWFTGDSAKSVRRCAGLFEDRMPRLYTPTGEAMTVLGSAVHGGRTGLWGVREGRPLALAFFVDEDHLRLQFSAYRPGERARLADAARVSTPLATPSQVAELATAIAEQAELFAAGGVPAEAAGAFRSRMVGNVQTLARWLGMSEPVELVSYASPYGGPDLVDEVRRAHV